MPNPISWIDPFGLTPQKEDPFRQQNGLEKVQVQRGPVFAGHGSITPGKYHTVPEGTSLTTYAIDGSSITDDLGQAIESGKVPSGIYSKTYGPGEKIPEYVLHPGDEKTTISASSIQVKRPTPINELLQPNSGACDWAACSTIFGHPNENIIHHTDGVYRIDKVGGVEKVSQWDGKQWQVIEE